MNYKPKSLKQTYHHELGDRVETIETYGKILAPSKSTSKFDSTFH